MAAAPDGRPLQAAALNRATLARQLLLQRERIDPAAAVRRVVGLQAQEPPSVYLALWNRLAGFDPAAVDRALADQRLVKATLMRFTLHVVHADDHPVMRSALQPSLRSRLREARFTAAGLPAEAAEALVPALLDHLHRPRTTAEVQEWLAQQTGASPKEVWRAVRAFAPVLHAPTGGPWSFGRRPAFVAAPAARSDPEAAPEEALQAFARRYLEGFGPASVADLAQFAMVHRSRARAALHALGDGLERIEGPDGGELFDVPGAPRPPADTPAPPRLLAMWDSVLLAYADRSRIIPPDYRKRVTRSNGDVLPTLLVDGRVAGVWRPVDDGIEVSAFHRLPAEDWEGLAAEAQALTTFLADRDPLVYRRYDRWWADLPAAEVRVLSADGVTLGGAGDRRKRSAG